MTVNKCRQRPYEQSIGTPPPDETTPPPRQTTPPPSVTQVAGRKVWVDDDNAHNTRPERIEVKLLADGQDTGRTPAWGRTTGSTWNYVFENLPIENEDGETIAYTVRETPVENYTASQDGTTITNTLIEKPPTNYVGISGAKTWQDRDNAGGRRPNFITVRLFRDGVEVDQRTVTAANGWAYTFDNQPRDDGYGNEHVYQVREDAVEGYFARVNGYDITNYLLPRNARPGDLENMTEEELEELVELNGYNTPLWGELLGTGDITPLYPFIFAGLGLIALLIALAAGRRRRKNP